MELKNKTNINKISNPKDVAKILQSILNAEPEFERDKEHFWIIGLNTNGTIRIIDLVTLGTLDSTLVSPREVFRYTIHKACASIILAHNHPSGNLAPSVQDLKITKQLTQGGEILDIEVLDHVIITSDSFASFKEEGYL